jgi:hypothetical protein
LERTILGTKAKGAAQAYTLLGSTVLFILAIQMLLGGIDGALAGNFESVIDVVLAIALFLMVILSIDACGFVYWKIRQSGALLALFGFIAIMIVLRNLSFDFLGWLLNAGTLAGLMILLAGILLMV